MQRLLLFTGTVFFVFIAAAHAARPECGDTIAEPKEKPLYELSEAEVGDYLHKLNGNEPNLRRRIMDLARKNIGQLYDIYLLGEFPFETYDPQPMYSLTKSDCVVFAEHTYAMALTSDWPSFMKLLQRIRYRDGQIGVATRNHYTEADWVKSNDWLVHDITSEIAGDAGVKFSEKIDRAKFLKGRYKLDVDIPVEEHHDLYLPYSEIGRIGDQLQDGDCINVVRAVVKPGDPPSKPVDGTVFVGHVGLVAHGPDGTLHMIHSSVPHVREEPLTEYIRRSTEKIETLDKDGKARLVGFKFLRLTEDPLASLREIDGPDAPRVKLPLEDASEFWKDRLQGNSANAAK
ncbi:MAG: N-acetylmuramoyl-L-alanine amidase-like domain-containing protein [Pirellulales bacterium]